MAYNNVKVKVRQVVAQSNTQTETLGTVSEVPMGEWSSETQYKKLNTVRSHNATYIAKKDNIGVEPTVTQGWQEVWQVVSYDGLVTPIGNYPDMTVGSAINAQNDGTGNNIANQFAEINEKIPSTASAENQLADKAFVNSSVNNLAAFYIEYNTQGDAFPTRADLLSATTFYNAGQPRVPTQNDYAYVLADESQPKDSLGNYPTTRYSYQGGTYPNGQWGFQYIVNNTSLTQAQVDAINSGITAGLVGQIVANGEVPIKNLYNLGAFDTYMSNGNGTGTVTRRTGYRTYKSSEVSLVNSQTNVLYYSIPKPFDYIYNNSYSGSKPIKANKFNITGGVAELNSTLNISVISSVFNATFFWIGFAPSTTLEQAQQAIDGLTMEYELATQYQYTKQVIENQPIHTLNQDGEQWVREEWKKGLNLWKPEWTPYTTFTTSGNSTHSLQWTISSNPDGYTNNIIRDMDNMVSTGRYFGTMDVPTSGLYYSRMGYNGNVVDDKRITQVYLEAGVYTISVDIAVNENNRIVINNTIMMSKGNVPYSYQPYYNNLPKRIQVLDTRNNDNTDKSVFPDRTVTPFFSNNNTPNNDWMSGLDVQGWDTEGANHYLGWEIVGYAGNIIANDSPLYHRQVNRNGGTIGSWKTILEIDPTKFEPTTANGWTVGDGSLAITEEGVYLIRAQLDDTWTSCGIIVMSKIGGNLIGSTAVWHTKTINAVLTYINSSLGIGLCRITNAGSSSSYLASAIAYKRIA